MNIAKIEENVQKVLKTSNQTNFIYDLLDAYGKPKASIKRLQAIGAGSYNLAKNENEVLWKKTLYFKAVPDDSIHSIIDKVKKNEAITKHEPRFLTVTNFNTLLAVDTKTGETLDIPFVELGKNFDFFLPWAGLEKTRYIAENPADVKAAEKMAKLFDLLKQDNPAQDEKSVHSLNVFLSRLLFCFFAEDTEIFAKGLFTNSIASHTLEDGSDLGSYLDKLFDVLNTQERSKYPQYLQAFPYVNGGLFGTKHKIPNFSRKSRAMLIECGSDLNWSQINPDIFGSMIQAVVHPDRRGNMGMHYTSVPNIMKVIEALFLNDLRESFEKNRDNQTKLEQLLLRLENLRIFDPACGSGNFLIIAYKELRQLEMEIFKRLQELARAKSLPFSRISLSQFFGIELDDFAHEIAILSLWLAEHQMNLKFKEVFGDCAPSLPLKQGGNIIHGNALRRDWSSVCPPTEGCEVVILGNPPYLGTRRQDESQSQDLKHVFGNDYKSVDYIVGWFYKAAEYLQYGKAKAAFVSTNSICQGEQVSLAWPKILRKDIEIGFCHSGFRWSNSAKANAGVTVVIIGLRKRSSEKKYIYNDGYKTEVKEINPYLVEGKTIYIHSRGKPLDPCPEMNFGNMPADGGVLLFTKQEKDAFIAQEPKSAAWFRKLISAKEYLNGIERWCLWLVDCPKHEIDAMPLVAQRVKQLKKIRQESSRPQLAEIPHLFAQITQPKDRPFILIPAHSSENRAYVPISIFDKNCVSHNSCLIIASQDPVLFGVLTSKMHMIWVRAVGGQLETRLRYSKEVVYNTFPFPSITEQAASEIKTAALKVISIRELYPDQSLADLYDPQRMPSDLQSAHSALDVLVERCYRNRPFVSDSERLSHLFDMYVSKTGGATHA